MWIAIRTIALELVARDAGVAFLTRLARARRVLFLIQRRNDGTTHGPYDWRKKAFLAAWGGSAAVAVMEGLLAGEFLQSQTFGFGDEEGDQRAAEHEAGEDLHEVREPG